MPNRQKRWTFFFVLLLVAGGFLLPFWPLEIIAILLAGMGGLPVVALCLGLILDLAYGTPTGTFEHLYFPFVLAAGIAILARLLASRYVLES